MKLKVKNIGIATGGTAICLINKKDAEFMDLHNGDRVNLGFPKKTLTAIIDVTDDNKILRSSEIGLFKELTDKSGARNGTKLSVSITKKPRSLKYIRRKLDGAKLSAKEIDEIVKDIVENKLSDVELTYFVAACYTYVMDMEETVALTKSMINNGDILKLDKYPVIDKHCVGGVAGNRTTMVVVPIIAAAGLTIPKTSSRSITSPAGTADTMEVLCNVNLKLPAMKKVVQKTNGCLMWGGAINLAPADDKIIKVEHPLSIDARSQLLASIIAKKGSVSATHILVDIPIGRGAKFENKTKALSLKKYFESIGKKLGMTIKVVLTDGSQPIGNGFGPALEARDVMWVFENDKRAPKDLRKKSIYLAGLILEMAKKAKPGKGIAMAKKILESGKAYKKMMEIIKAQGKKTTPSKIKLGKYKKDILSTKTGTISHIDNKIISRIARVSGAPKSQGAGLYLYKHVGEKVLKNEVLYTIYADSQEKLKFGYDVSQENSGIEIKNI